MVDASGVNGTPEPSPNVVTDTTLQTGAGSSVTARVLITNRAGAPRSMLITPMGADPDWLPGPSQSRVLAPGETILAELTLSPAIGTLPARYPIAVAVQAVDPGTGQATSPTLLTELSLIVDAPGQVGIELTPTDARAVFGKKISIALSNMSATPTDVRLETQTSDSAPIRLDQTQLRLQGGESRAVGGRVRVGRVRLFGHKARHSFSVTARSGGAPVHVEGSLTARAMFGPGGTKFTVLAAVVAVWVALAIVFIPKLASSIKDKHTITAQSVQSASPSASKGGSGATGSSNGGKSGSTKPGNSGAAKSGASKTDTLQLSGTVAGSAPSGVDVTLAPTTLAAEDLSGVTGVGVDAQLFQSIGKIPASALPTAPLRGEPSRTSVTTTADGTWSFASVRTPGYYLLTFAKPGYQTMRYVVNSASAAAQKPLAVTLVPGQGHLSGTINGPGGSVAGATITITDGTNTLTTSSNSRGRIGQWSVTGLSTPSTYLVQASKPGLGTESALINLDAGGRASVNLTLHSGVSSLVGTVSGDAGPIGGATVTATDGTITRTATTITAGAVGRYVLPDLPAPGKYTVTLSAAGYQPQTERVQLTAAQPSATVNASLTSSNATINGIVQSLGKPVSGAGLTLRSSTNAYKLTTTAEGRFTFTGVAPGTYVLSAQYFGLVTGYITVVASPGRTQDESIDLPPATAQVSNSSVTGFVGDGANPSNTLCASSTLSKCTVSFVLCKAKAGDHGTCGTDQSTWVKLSAGEGAPSTTPSISPPAPSGPTGYTLTPDKSGLAPGLYHLTITVTDANAKQTGISYLPATVNVQVPFDGVAHAPQVSLYSAGSIAGTISSTFDWTGTGDTTCVWAVPIGTAAPADGDCTPPTTAGCSATGLASPSVANLQGLGGAYTVAGLCNGTYQMYVRTTNPDFTWVTPTPPVVITVLNGSSGSFNSSLVRLGRIQLQMVYATGGSVTPSALADTVLAPGSECAPASPIPNQGTVDLSGIETDGTGNVLVTGLQPGSYACTIKATTGSQLEVSATAEQISVNFDMTTNVSVTLAVTVKTFIGQVATNWSGTAKGVGGITVNVTGAVGFDANGHPIAKTAPVVTDSSGCFAIGPIANGATPPPAPASGPCAGDATIPTAPLDLKAPTADFVINATDAGALGYQGQSDLGVTVTSLTPANPEQLQLFPKQVTFGGKITALPLGVAMSSVKAAVRDQPGGTGTITAVVNSDGTISWGDSQASGGQILPGNYTVEFNGSGLAPWQYRFQCAILVPCVPTFDLSANGLGTLQLTGLPTTPLDDQPQVTLLNNGTSVGSPQAASSGSVSFPGLLPTVGYKAAPKTPAPGDSWAAYSPQPVYSVTVQAAGYLFGTSGDGNVTLNCGSSPGNEIPLPASSTASASSASCTVSLTPDGSISGKLTGVNAKAGSASPTQALNNTLVTAQACEAGTADTGAGTCTVTGPVFSGTTDANGNYTITGTTAAQGLDPGSWLVTTDSTGYSADGAPSGTTPTQPTKLIQIPNTGSRAVSSVDFTLYVNLVQKFTVTVGDGSGNALVKPVTSVTMTPSGGGTTLTAKLDTTNNDYVFTDVVPGKYDIKATGTQFSDTTDYSVPVQQGSVGSPGEVPYLLVVSLHTNTVAGTVSGKQGSGTGPAPLNGVTVEIGTGTTIQGFTVSTGVDGKTDMTTTTPTGGQSAGAFSFTGVPDSPQGGWSLLLSRPGYTTKLVTGLTVNPTNQQPSLSYTLDRVTHKVVITVNATSSSDNLSGVSAVKLVYTKGTGDSDPGSNADQAPTSTDTSVKGKITASFEEVPFGCWKFQLTLPDNHFGTLSLKTPPPPPPTALSCPTGSVTVPTTGTSEVDATYGLDESALDVSLTATASTTPGGAADSVPDMTVTVSDSSQQYFTSGSWTDGSSVTLWLPATAPDGKYTASVHTTDTADATAWPAPDDTVSATVPTSGAFPLEIEELAQLGVTVVGASSTNEATVTVSPSDGQTVPDAYSKGVTTSGATTLYLPDGNWKVTATLGTAPDQQSATTSVDLSTDQANTTKITPTWASITVTVTGASATTPASITLTCLDSQTQPSGCANGITGSDDGSGTLIANDLAAGNWSVYATLDTPNGTKGVYLTVDLTAGQQWTKTLTPQWSSVTVDVPGAGSGSAKATVELTCTSGQTYPAKCSTSPVTESDTGSGADFVGLAPGTWSIKATIGSGSNQKTYTGSVTLLAGRDGNNGDGKPVTLS